MKKSTAKKRMGRPPTGRTPLVSMALPKQTLDTIDKLARQHNTTRSTIMRQLIDEALAARKKS
jgi:metal-responsive CopG/Arc/MetJ family transcriptional regulator